MSNEAQAQLYLMKGVISETPQHVQNRIQDIKTKIEDVMQSHDTEEANIALTLLMTEVAIEMEKTK